MVKIAIDDSRDDVYHFTRTNEHWTPDRTQLTQKGLVARLMNYSGISS